MQHSVGREGVWNRFAAVGVAVLCLFTRLPFLNRLSLHWDEDISILAARGIAETGVATLPSGRIYLRAPLYHYLIAPFAAGGSDWLPRLASVALSAVTGFMIVRLGRRIAGDRAALLAGVLYALSIVEITIARPIRMYSLYQSIAFVAILFLFEFWRTGRLRWGWAATAAIAASHFAHEMGSSLALLFLPIAIHQRARAPRLFALGATAFFAVAGTLYSRFLRTMFEGTRPVEVVPMGADWGAGSVGLFRSRIAADPFAVAMEPLGTTGAILLAGVAIAAGIGLGVWAARDRGAFAVAAASFGFAAALALAGTQEIGLAVTAIFILFLHRSDLFGERRWTAALLATSLLVFLAGIAWFIIHVEAGFAMRDVLLGLVFRPMRLGQILLYPSMTAAMAILGLLIGLRAIVRGSCHPGITFILIVIAWELAGRSVARDSVQTRYLADVLVLWEMLAAWASIQLLEGLVSRARRAGRLRLARILGPAVSGALAVAFLTAPGTGIGQTRTYLARAHGETVFAGYQTNTFVPDLRGACAWLAPRLQPGDRIVATDWMTTYAYLGQVDGWLRGRAYAWQSVLVDGVPRDCYIGAQVLPTLPELLTFARGGGPVWIVLDAGELVDPDPTLGPLLREWLLAHEPLFIASDGLTRVLRWEASGGSPAQPGSAAP